MNRSSRDPGCEVGYTPIKSPIRKFITRTVIMMRIVFGSLSRSISETSLLPVKVCTVRALPKSRMIILASMLGIQTCQG
ncbi:MAG: hypothetical protein ACUVV4_02805 [Candidatus Bathyarchaeia archaeon]